MGESKAYRVWLGLVVGIGLVLRFIVYLRHDSLWYDEGFLSTMMLRIHLTDILHPERMAYFRFCYPPGFFAAVKGLMTVAGDDEWILRLFPFLCSLASMVLFPWAARAFMGRTAQAWGTALFAILPNVIYFSAEAKPYSSDILGAVLVLGGIGRCLDANLSWRKTVLGGVAGVGGMLFSLPAVFLLAGGGAALCAEKFLKRQEKEGLRALILTVSWGTAFFYFYHLYLRPLTELNFFTHYWKVALAPGPVWTPSFWTWLIGTSALFFTMCAKTPVSLSVFCGVIGVVSYVKRSIGRSVLLTGPCLAVLGAAMLGRYPLQNRVLVFLLPVLVMALSRGSEVLVRPFSRWSRWGIGALLTIQFFFFSLINSGRLVMERHGRSEVRPVLEYVARHARSGDVLYVYYGASQAVYYYLHRQKPIRLPEGVMIRKGRPALDTWTGYIEDIESLQGKDRVWFLFSDIYYARKTRSERDFFLTHLNQRGVLRDRFEIFRRPYLPPHFSPFRFSAGAYLYDLNPSAP